MGHDKLDQRWELRLLEHADHRDHVLDGGRTVRRVDRTLEWRLYLGGHFICEGTADDDAHAVEQAESQVRSYVDDKVQRVHGQHRTIVLDHDQITADGS